MLNLCSNAVKVKGLHKPLHALPKVGYLFQWFD
jgi:hypothetical protein